jgi:hypothetical protein
MSHDLGDFPAHVELSNPSRIVWLVKFVAVGRNARLQRQIGRWQEQAAEATEDEEYKTSPSPAGRWLCRKMHGLGFGKSPGLASDTNTSVRLPQPSAG